MSEENKKIDYSADSIQALEGMEHVRMRPSMYIGDVGVRGLHHLVYEVVDNSIDEALAGYCDTIYVTILEGDGIRVKDNGRGIPVGIHKKEGVSALEVVMTKIGAGGKFDKDSYKVSGGLHGVGVSCVNALSVNLRASVHKEGRIWEQEYSRGKKKYEVKQVGDTDWKGTEVEFFPDPEIFDFLEYNYETLATRMRELAYLNKGITIELVDERSKDEEGNFKKEVFHSTKGLSEFVEYLDGTRERLIANVVSMEGEKNGIPVEVAMVYNSSYSENIHSYVNNINTHEGGTHLSGFRRGLTHTLKKYAEESGLLDKLKFEIAGDDFREGLTAIVSVKVGEPQFEGQTKTKLGNSEVKGIVEQVTNEKLAEFLDENPKAGKVIAEKCLQALRSREAAKRARDLTRRKSFLENSTLPGKLADCSIKDPDHCEIYIVEGDSAGGSAKMGRDRSFQAILPLKGKILNVEKARLDKILGNEEIRTLVSAIGTSIGSEDFDIEKLRYKRIIIMTDADVDGAHIRTLILTFFFRYMRELLDLGYIYIAQPPLYKLKKGKTERYCYTDAEKDRIMVEMNGGKSESDSKINIQRYKGLGEMNPDQLWETTMDPEKRSLLRVSMENAAEADHMFSILMGDVVEPRRAFIEENATYVSNLDI